MKRTDGFHTSESHRFTNKKYSAIQNYLRRISEIKNDTHLQPDSNQSHHKSHSNFLVSSAQFNPNPDNQIIFKRSNAPNSHKKRCFSMKSQIMPQYSTPSNEKRLKTTYNQKFNLTSVKIRQNLLGKSFQSHEKNQTEIKNPLQKGFYQTKVPIKRVITEPNETFFSSFDSRARINTSVSENKMERQGSLEKMQTAKRQIFQKIHLYVRNLDQKGEDELNQMLTSDYRKRIRFHSQADRYEAKIKQMMCTNKEIVKILRQELLTESNPANYSERINLSQPYALLSNESLSPEKNITIDPLQINFQDKLKNESRNLQSNLGDYQNSDSPDSKQDLQPSKVKTFHQQNYNDKDYQHEVHHVTKQFSSEWNKSQTHKKAIYQKFRSTIFQKYPEIRKRSRAIKGLCNGQIVQSSSSSDDQNLSAHIQFDDGNKKFKNDFKNANGVKSPQLKSRKISVQLKSQVSPSKSNAHQSLLNTQAGEGKQNFSKIGKLSKKNSISKGSSRVLDLLHSQNKQEVTRINFKNLVDFIFKRAFFYSVSKNKVIQNKVPYGKMQYVPTVEKKDPNISFMLYNKSIKEKQYLRTEKLNEKNMRATGQFLIKNKYKIMGLQKEGKKSCDFLRKCLEDAVEDYLKGTKPK